MAEDARQPGKVVLRILPDSLPGADEKESSAITSLHHPNIAAIYETGSAGQINFIVSEYAEGETLRERLQRAPINLAETLAIAIQIASALQAAHDNGIIHGHLGPNQAIIGKGGNVKVVGFGLAGLIDNKDSGEEAATMIQGAAPAESRGETDIYRSPEQLRGLEIDERSDIFSLGVMLYQMLARKHPFAGETSAQSLISVLEKEPPPLESVTRRLPARIERIVKYCLAKKANERYQSVQALLADLRKLQMQMEAAAKGERQTQAAPPAPPPPARPEAAPAPNDVSVTGVVTIAHVMFCDVVGFTILPIDRQKKLMRTLQRIVRETEDYQRADEQGQLVRLPAGDGMALAFMQDVTAPVRCACDIARALREYPEIRLRIGIHSGAVFQSTDINSIRNVVGDGINLAHRVMDCGDSGHILVSRPVAEVLSHISRWTPDLHDLGEVEVKHGVRIHLFNLAGADFGNPDTPSKLKKSSTVPLPPASRPPVEQPRVVEETSSIGQAANRRWWLLGALVVALILAAATWRLWPRPETERDLTYFLTIQRYRDGQPFGEEFPSSGQEIFEEGWKFKLHLTSRQEGYFYLLNEELDGSGANFALLFPLPSFQSGSARLAALEMLQTDWYIFDQQARRELLRLIWSAQPVPELEALRVVANPIDRGRVSNPSQIEAVRVFLSRHRPPPGTNAQSLPNKQTLVRGTGQVLVWSIELEHR